MLAISNILDISLDYMMKGKPSRREVLQMECNETALIHALSRCTERQHAYAIRLLEVYLASLATSDKDME